MISFDVGQSSTILVKREGERGERGGREGGNGLEGGRRRVFQGGGICVVLDIIWCISLERRVWAAVKGERRGEMFGNRICTDIDTYMTHFLSLIA